MSLPRYADYKDSGADWIGSVPMHWAVEPIKRGFVVVGGSTPKSDEATYWDGVIVWVSPADLSRLASMYIEDSSRKISYAGLNSCGTALVPPGSIVLSTRAPIGSLAVARTTLCTNQGCKSLVPNAAVNSLYFAYVLLSATTPLNLRGKGTTFLELSADELAGFKVPFPPPEEQTAIAAFLDRETAKIDALISEQEKLIALLAEKRQATISHAVTRGLNPAAPMKDSGVAWLEEVPAHWKVGKAGFYISVLPGYAFPSNGFSLDDSDVKLLRGINVGVGELRWDEVVYWPRTEVDGLEAFELQAGDVVIGMDRPLISSGMRVAFVKQQDLPCLLLQRVAKVQPGSSVDGRFIMRLLSSRVFEAHFTPETTGVSVPHISGEQISSFVIPVPPLAEQRRICDFLETELVKLEALNHESECAIALLGERRSALIAAAVTGQIDVRQAV